ncbi:MULTISPECIES: hypothetical protein [unclassified Crossiella]|uniref:hypothetical protein n=1 Tax=unclassified Crossiella TaxID=2620835 RepID=UPI001FFF30CC|nr:MULTISPECIES: hypothetical protein [unclassified Crossiella]MCK2244099.1 hypothetical protein [Crossiella sp. S99.2]MCK2257903.1 hypothetical protein [Crossiella sp. S99.1]
MDIVVDRRSINMGDDAEPHLRTVQVAADPRVADALAAIDLPHYLPTLHRPWLVTCQDRPVAVLVRGTLHYGGPVRPKDRLTTLVGTEATPEFYCRQVVGDDPQLAWDTAMATRSVREAAWLGQAMAHGDDPGWRRVQEVVRRATKLAASLSEPDRDTLITAAWAIDIGGHNSIAPTGFRPLDSARHLRAYGGGYFSEEVMSLVAHRGGARQEAAERGLTKELAEFPFQDTPLLALLTKADRSARG